MFTVVVVADRISGTVNISAVSGSVRVEKAGDMVPLSVVDSTGFDSVTVADSTKVEPIPIDDSDVVNKLIVDDIPGMDSINVEVLAVVVVDDTTTKGEVTVLESTNLDSLIVDVENDAADVLSVTADVSVDADSVTVVSATVVDLMGVADAVGMV